MYKNLTPADLHAVDPHPQDSNSVLAHWAEANASGPLAEQKERYLRLAADFDNFRKRTARELESRAARQKEEFVRELLPVIDNLSRALAISTQTPADPLRHGIEVTLRQAMELLRAHGFEPRDDLGAAFDPAFHQAVCTRAEPGQPHHSVLEVWQRGWMRGPTLFRPAQVVVNDLGGQSKSQPAPARSAGQMAMLR